jgi:acetate---CoA ligase (ADP-forming)
VLDAILDPRRVAVIGASNSPARIGGRPIQMSLEGGFDGDIFPVNPNYETVQGLKAYSAIGDVPGTVDCAVVSVPVAIAVDAVRACANAGVRSLVMFTSGFAEMGVAGEAAQAEVASIARDSGMRIVGPNCLGVFNLQRQWYATFANIAGLTKLPPGPTGIVSQSGAYGTHVYVASQLRGLGAKYWVTTGNEVDVDVAEVIAHYATAPDVELIVAYAEGMKDPNRIRQALAMARDARKPVVFMKVGTTDAGARAAASHTASLAGADDIYEALFRQYGVYRARTTEELVDIAYACQFGKFPKGRTVALQTISGGVGVQMADDSVRHGLEVTPVPEETQAKLKELVAFAGVNNPIDFTGQAVNEPTVIEKNIDIIMGDTNYDSHVFYLAGLAASPVLGATAKEMFERIRSRYPDEVMLLSMFENEKVSTEYAAMGYPFFGDPSLAVRALRGLVHFGEVFARGTPDAPPALPSTAMALPSKALAEHEALACLSSAGIAVARNRLVTDAVSAVAAAQELGPAVVMKIASSVITHKSDIGGVLVNIRGDADVAAGFETLMERGRAHAPEAALDGVLVAEMIQGGVETVLGVVRDPLFGPAVMFGLGGILVEVLGDVTFRLAPFGVDEAHRMINEIKGRAVLDGVRGAPASDIDSLAQTLAALSVFASEHADALDSIDINPFIVLPQGGVAVDALIVPATT